MNHIQIQIKTLTTRCLYVRVNVDIQTMEQRTLKNENNCLNTNICSYLETSGGKSYIL
jgi:hypothetical protein